MARSTDPAKLKAHKAYNAQPEAISNSIDSPRASGICDFIHEVILTGCEIQAD
jgi:hypothetical protein